MYKRGVPDCECVPGISPQRTEFVLIEFMKLNLNQNLNQNSK